MPESAWTSTSPPPSVSGRVHEMQEQHGMTTLLTTHYMEETTRCATGSL